MIGRKLAHYEIVEKLGEGGMGTVYKARDTHLDRFVAIKILAHEKVADPERKLRFSQEAKSASALNHPNIVTIYDISEDGGIDYIAMEYIPGAALDARIGRTGLRISEALKYAVQMADALSAAHGAGILHRDLKPANVMVTASGHVKVLDFGLAKLTDRTETTEHDMTRTVVAKTQDGAVMGTLAYMSPEQAEAHKLDFRSDIFSFGAVLYEMVTGQRAFTGESAASTMSAILRDDPKPAILVRPEIPRELDKLIARCLRKDPARRVQSMADLKVALEDLADDVKSGRVEAVAAPPPPSTRTGKRLVIGLVIFILIASVAWILWVWPAKNPPADTALSVAPLTGNTGLETDPTFSPDGTQVAYSWNGEKEDNFDIYVKLIGPGAPIRLTTNSARDHSPRWSPDGRTIAFLRPHGAAEDIVLIPALGGPERVVGQSTVYGLCWTPDSQHLVMTPLPASGASRSVVLLNIATGERRILAQAPVGIYRYPSLTLDGRMLAFVHGSSSSTSDLYTLALSADLQPQGEPHQLTFDNRNTLESAWTTDGREIIYSAGNQSNESLWRVPLAGSVRARRLESAGEDGDTVAIAPRGNRLIYSRHVTDTNVWRIQIANGKPSAPARFIYSTRQDIEPRYSSDGRKVAFSSSRSGNIQVWTADADGSNAVQLTTLQGGLTSGPRWSPDGQRIVFLSNVEGQAEIFTISTAGGAPRRLTDNPAHDTAPSWSHDGKWIYFGSNRSGTFQVWKMPSDGGDAVQVTRNGGYAALESIDGKYLYYCMQNTREGIWRVPVGGGEETKIIPSLMNWGNFAVAARGIYFVPVEQGEIRLYDFATTQTTTIAHIEKPLEFGLSATADGSSIIYTQIDRETSELLVVENFT